MAACERGQVISAALGDVNRRSGGLLLAKRVIGEIVGGEIRVSQGTPQRQASPSRWAVLIKIGVRGLASGLQRVRRGPDENEHEATLEKGGSEKRRPHEAFAGAKSGSEEESPKSRTPLSQSCGQHARDEKETLRPKL